MAEGDISQCVLCADREASCHQVHPYKKEGSVHQRGEQRAGEEMFHEANEWKILCYSPNSKQDILVPRKLGFFSYSNWLLSRGKLEITQNYIHYYFAYRASQSVSLDWALQRPTRAETQTFQTLHSLSRAHSLMLVLAVAQGTGAHAHSPHCVSPQLPVCPALKAAGFGPGCAPRSSTAALAGCRPRVAA